MNFNKNTRQTRVFLYVIPLRLLHNLITITQLHKQHIT